MDLLRLFFLCSVSERARRAMSSVPCRLLLSHRFHASACSRSQAHQASIPSPVLAETGKIFRFGLRMCANVLTAADHRDEITGNPTVRCVPCRVEAV